MGTRADVAGGSRDDDRRRIALINDLRERHVLQPAAPLPLEVPVDLAVELGSDLPWVALQLAHQPPLVRRTRSKTMNRTRSITTPPPPSGGCERKRADSGGVATGSIIADRFAGCRRGRSRIACTQGGGLCGKFFRRTLIRPVLGDATASPGSTATVLRAAPTAAAPEAAKLCRSCSRPYTERAGRALGDSTATVMRVPGVLRLDGHPPSGVLPGADAHHGAGSQCAAIALSERLPGRRPPGQTVAPAARNEEACGCRKLCDGP